MQLSYSWRKVSLEERSVEYNSTIHLFTKIERGAYKRVHKDKMNGIGRLYIQLRYS